jgi:hypothetical protein
MTAAASGTHLARASRPGPGTAKARRGICPLTWPVVVERVTRIELALSAWESDSTTIADPVDLHECPRSAWFVD